MSAALRVVVCGQSAQIAKGVKAGLLPECESETDTPSFPHSRPILIFPAIHVVFSAAAGAKDIPAILSGRAPPATDEPNVGTGNYSRKTDAIIVGGVYGDEQFNEMRNSCAELPGNGGAAWLRLNMSTPTPPLGSVILPNLI